jgi:hypothetical protein
VAAAGRLAVAGAAATTNPLTGLVFMNSTMDVINNHQTSTPRRRAMSSRVRNFDKAFIVALTMFTGLLEPRLLVRMSFTPAD